MNSKLYNLFQNNKKFIYIYSIIFSVIVISLLVLYLLGNIERTAYLSEFHQVSNNNYHCKINYYGNKIFRHSDIYGVYPYFKQETEYEIIEENLGRPFISLISDKDLKENDKIDVQYKLKLKLTLIMYVLAFLIIIPLIYFKCIKKSYIILILINTALYYIILLFILPLFSLINLKFSAHDILFTNLFVIIAYILFNNKLLPTSLFILVNIFSFFIIEPIALTYQNTILLITDIPILYSTLLEVISLGLKIITITVTFIYFAIIIYLLVLMIMNLMKMNRKKSIVLISLILISAYFIFFKNIKIGASHIDFVNYASRLGIINTINLRISYDINNNKIQSKEDVLSALNILTDYENNRDLSNLLLENSVNNKRDIFLIFLESFYDYSHFTNLFDKDPFPEEYRKWANNSRKIAPNIGGGSFYARFTGLTASSPMFPKTQSKIIETTLPDIMYKNGYETIALEESGNTYNLATFLPNIGFKNVVFNLGVTNIANYIDDNFEKLDKPIFVYGFTLLGHTGFYLNNDFDNTVNNKRFIDMFNENDKLELVSTFDNSAMTAIEIIDIRDTILKHSPNALIIFKHDHLFSTLRSSVERSSIDNDIKMSFLNDNTPTPILIWDGTNGAYKAPIDFMPENIPMFIALNAGVTNYNKSIISLLYKEEIDSAISTYHQYYRITNDTLVLENNINEDSKIFKYENAQRILSQDIFQGKKHYYNLIKELTNN